MLKKISVYGTIVEIKEFSGPPGSGAKAKIKLDDGRVFDFIFNLAPPCSNELKPDLRLPF